MLDELFRHIPACPSCSCTTYRRASEEEPVHRDSHFECSCRLGEWSSVDRPCWKLAKVSQHMRRFSPSKLITQARTFRLTPTRYKIGSWKHLCGSGSHGGRAQIDLGHMHVGRHWRVVKTSVFQTGRSIFYKTLKYPQGVDKWKLGSLLRLKKGVLLPLPRGQDLYHK